VTKVKGKKKNFYGGGGRAIFILQEPLVAFMYGKNNPAKPARKLAPSSLGVDVSTTGVSAPALGRLGVYTVDTWEWICG